MVLLCSGGIDSLLSFHLLKDQIKHVVFFDYKQPARHQEHLAAIAIAEGLFGKKVTRIDTADLSTKMSIGVGEKGSRVVPNRNLIMISIAHSLYNMPVVIGANKDDYNDYEDCRPEYFEQLSKLLKCDIVHPLTSMTKKEIIDSIRKNKLPLDYTWSCYQPIHDKPCETCNSCKENAGL